MCSRSAVLTRRRRRGIGISRPSGPSRATASATGCWTSTATSSCTACEKHDKTRSIPRLRLERPWERCDVALRERTPGRLPYKTAARADEVLRLNVEDLDVAGKRARPRSNRGDTDWLFSGSAIAFVSGAAPRMRALRRLGDHACLGCRSSAMPLVIIGSAPSAAIAMPVKCGSAMRGANQTSEAHRPQRRGCRASCPGVGNAAGSPRLCRSVRA